MVLDPGFKTRGMQQNAIDYDGPISFIGTSEEIAAAVMQLVSKRRDGSDDAQAGRTAFIDERGA